MSSLLTGDSSLQEAERLAERLKQGDELPGGASHVSAPSPSQETVSANNNASGPATRLRTSSRIKGADATQAQAQALALPPSRGAAKSSANGTSSAAPQPSAPISAESLSGPAPIEVQGFLDTERSYTNAFHKTLSLFVDDKTFSTPSLRAAVVGFLESSNATVLESLPQNSHAVPDHLKQEIENHVNLVKTVLQRGGVFAEDFLRARLKKLAAHIPRIEAAMMGSNRSGKPSSSKAPVLLPRAGDPYNPRDLSPDVAAANQAALAQAAEAAARANNRHHQEILNAGMTPPPGPGPQEDAAAMIASLNGFGGPNGPPPPPQAGHPPPLPAMSGPPQQGQIAIQPQQLPPMRGKTFVPPNLVPSQAGPGQRADEGGGSPPPILAPFDPRPNPMACLFCRQRKIRCIGHKPHPCEICVKRGFVCSYDWISRRGKRKPKNQDGSPLDMPPGSVSMALSPSESMGGPPLPLGGGSNVPVVVGGQPPAVGMHPGPPGMHPGMHMPGQPTPDGTFGGFQFMPGHHPGAPYPPPHPHMHPQMPPQAPHQQPPAQSLSPSGGSSAAAESLATEENGMMIDPSLIEHSTVGNGNGNENGKGRGDADTDGACTFCKEQDLDCGGTAPETCLNCSRRQLSCQYDTPTAPPSSKTTPSKSTKRVSAMKAKQAAAESSTASPQQQTGSTTKSKKQKRLSEGGGAAAAAGRNTKKRKTAHSQAMDVDDNDDDEDGGEDREQEDEGASAGVGEDAGGSADGDAEMEGMSDDTPRVGEGETAKVGGAS